MPIAFHAGLEGPFYGCDGLFFKIGETIYRCAEDESDGYRSYMGEPEIWEDGAGAEYRPIFFDTPLDTVWVCPEIVKHEHSVEMIFDGWRLISTTSGRTWLRFGTNNRDDYYPTAEWDYTPLHDPNKEVH